MHLIILDRHNGHFIGGTGFNTFKWSIPSGDIGYWCRVTEQGKGYIREAVNALVIYGFKTIGLRRITIRADAGNRPSRQVAESLGFQQELEAKGFMEKPGSIDLRTGCLYSRLNMDGLNCEKVEW